MSKLTSLSCRLAVIATLGCLALSSWRPWTREALAQTPAISAKKGLTSICPRCEHLAGSTFTLGETKRRLTQIKALDHTTNTVRLYAFDENANQISDVALKALEKADVDATRARLGNLTEKLAARSALAPADQMIRIRATTLPRVSHPKKEDLLGDPALMATWLADLEAAKYEASRAATRVLISAGARIIRTESFAVVADVTPRALRDLRLSTAIDYINAEATDPLIAKDAFDAMENRAGQYSSIQGNGITVGFKEPYPPTSSWLAQLPGLPPNGRLCESAGGCGFGTFHALNMMGMVRRQDTNQSTATLAKTVVADGDGSLGYGFDWLLNTWHTPIINLSAARSTSCPITTASASSNDAIEMDIRAKLPPFPLFVAAASNENDCVKNVSFNGLIVGGSVGSARSPQSMWADSSTSGSSWQNPSVFSPHLDRELPHLVAPACASQISGGTGCGTSIATALVSGVAARLMSHSKGYFLNGWPEAIRALLMASADLNVEGQIYRGGSAGTDYKDGVGLISARAALAIMDVIDQNPSTLALVGGVKAITVTPQTGVWITMVKATGAAPRFRAALAWDATANLQSKTEILDGDFDLSLQRSDGSEVVCADHAAGESSRSSSWDNSHEFFECKVTNPSPDGLYRLNVYNFGLTGNSWVAVAWQVK